MSLEEPVSALERVVKLVERHGLLRIFKAIFVIIAFFFVLYNGQNMSEAVQQVKDNEENLHDAALQHRRKIGPEIETGMVNLLLNTGADRVFVLEMHNGTANASGLPFYFGDITYEKVAPGIEHIYEDYTNLNLSRFPFISYLDSVNSWRGGMDQLMRIDDKFALRLQSNDANYVILETIHGLSSPIGFVGLSYCGDHVPRNVGKASKELNVFAKKMSILLDLKKIDLTN